MRIFRYRLPLTLPLVTPAGVLIEREGYLVELTDDKRATGYGDMAPLPGFSSEAGAADLSRALATACRERRETSGDCEEDLAGVKLLADFAWLCALMDMRRRPCETASIEVNGLLDPRAGDLDRQIDELRSNKYRVVKVKTSGSEPGEALQQAHHAAASLGGDVALRLDANRSWTLGQALAFCDGIRDLNVEYLEEPLRDPAGAVELRSRTGVPLAADESLREGECPWADVWVIKPTLDPNWLEHLQQTSERGQRAVISACFESGVGIAGLARLATKFPASAQSACGLDTYRWLARDILDLPLKFAEGRLLLSDVAASMDTVNTSGLECVLDE